MSKFLARTGQQNFKFSIIKPKAVLATKDDLCGTKILWPSENIFIPKPKRKKIKEMIAFTNESDYPTLFLGIWKAVN